MRSEYKRLTFSREQVARRFCSWGDWPARPGFYHIGWSPHQRESEGLVRSADVARAHRHHAERVSQPSLRRKDSCCWHLLWRSLRSNGPSGQSGRDSDRFGARGQRRCGHILFLMSNCRMESLLMASCSRANAYRSFLCCSINKT